MSIEQSKLLADNSICQTGMNVDIKNHIKNCFTCLDFQQTQQKEKSHHEITCKPWKEVGADMFTLNSKNYLVS